MFLSVSSEEYLLAAGLLASFIGLLVSLFYSRRDIADALRTSGFRLPQLIAALIVVLLFVVVEAYTVKPTQLLFFDDVIYQNMAMELLHIGQAVMCNFGTPTSCFAGQIFHEPVGTALNLAIGYAIGGMHLTTTYGTDLAISALAVFMTIICGSLLFKNNSAALFSGIFMALAPIMLVWALPTTSDMPALLYALIALFSLLVFVKARSNASFAMLLFSSALLTYMKVDAIAMLPVLLIGFFLLSGRNPIRHIKSLYSKKYSDIVYILVIIFLALVAISAVYVYSESLVDNFGSQGTVVPNSCGFSQSITATGPFSSKIFLSNICANVGFFLGSYNSQRIMQPALYAVLAAVGAAVMLRERKGALPFVFLWFIVFFVIYTAFYAGAVTFGIDWRFMLADIAPLCLAAGYGAEKLSALFAEDLRYAARKTKSLFSRLSGERAVRTAVRGGILLLALYSFIGFIPALSIQPSQIQQAGDARFYESFVFNNSDAIPASCLVFSYDPTLFLINNRSSAQMFYLYNSTFMQNATKHYSCLVEDRGFWCYTPNNLCTNINKTYDATPIVTAEYGQQGKTFGFYYLTPSRK
jgi:ABC-type multidrug transport system fused ATPase/permease subunit